MHQLFDNLLCVIPKKKADKFIMTNMKVYYLSRITSLKHVSFLDTRAVRGNHNIIS